MAKAFRNFPDRVIISGGKISVTGSKTIKVQPVGCMDSLKQNYMLTQEDIIVDISTNGLNGLDTGSVTNDTIYYLYIIKSKKYLNDLPEGFVFSLSNIAPGFPHASNIEDYDLYRKLGTFKVDSSGNIVEQDLTFVIKEIVDTYADLPGTPDDVNDIYLVRNGSGVWLINRKPSGLYKWDIGSASWVHMSAFPEQHNDANFELYNNSDNTKRIKFSGGLITTGNIRTITMADRNLDLNNPIFNTVNYDLLSSAPTHSEGCLFYDVINHTFVAYNDIIDVALNIGEETWIRVLNNNGSIIPNGTPVYVDGSSGSLPTISLAKADLKNTSIRTLGLTTHDIGIGEEGIVTNVGLIRDVDTSSWNEGDVLYLSATAEGELVTTEPLTPNYSIIMGTVIVSNATTGKILTHVTIGTNKETVFNFFNGATLETVDVDVLSSGGTVTLEIEQLGGGNITFFFSDGFYVLGSTPVSVTLTPGTDTDPQINYVFLDQSDKTLKSNTSGWPSTEHAPIATVYLRSALITQTDGALKVHVWTDHIAQSNGQGHLSDINFWIRSKHATWKSGALGSTSVTGSGPSTVYFSNDTGIILQLHDHDFPSFSMPTEPIHIVNDFTTPYKQTTDLATELTDANGNSMSGKYFSFVIWGVVSEKTKDCHLMCNLPESSWNSTEEALIDANFDIPSEFIGVGFLISHIVLRHQSAGGGTWTLQQEKDLRGTIIGVGGSGGQSSNILASNVITDITNFDNNLSSADDDVQKALDTLDNILIIEQSEKGAPNGVATLDAGSKIPSSQLPSTVMEFKGNWDASTNTPTLVDGTGTNGDTYRASAPGTQDLGSGSQTWAIGDWVTYNGSIWQKSPGSDAVLSVNSKVGVVVLNTGDISEVTDKNYVTDAEKSTIGTDSDAIHDNVASEISAITSKGTPTTSDLLLIEDVADSNNKKKINIGSLPSGVSGGNYLDDVKAFFGTDLDAYIVWNSSASYFEFRFPQTAGLWLWNLGDATRWFGTEDTYSELSHNANRQRWTAIETIFNNLNNDVDFKINKKTSGVALTYDAGDDKFTIDKATKGITALGNYRNVMENLYEFIAEDTTWRLNSSSNANVVLNVEVDGLFGCVELDLKTGRGASNYAVVTRETTNDGEIKLGQGFYLTEYILKTPSVMPVTATDEFTIFVGMNEVVNNIGVQVGGGTPDPGNIDDGVYFWTSNSYTNWQCATVKNGVMTNTDTGLSASASTKYVFRIEVNSGATEVNFYINDTLEGTHTTNIPDDVYIGHQIQLYANTGVDTNQILMYFDTCYERYEFTTQR